MKDWWKIMFGTDYRLANDKLNWVLIQSASSHTVTIDNITSGLLQSWENKFTVNKCTKVPQLSTVWRLKYLRVTSFYISVHFNKLQTDKVTRYKQWPGGGVLVSGHKDLSAKTETTEVKFCFLFILFIPSL